VNCPERPRSDSVSTAFHSDQVRTMLIYLDLPRTTASCLDLSRTGLPAPVSSNFVRFGPSYTLRTICAPDMTLTFLPSSFGVPKVEGLEPFLGAIQHVFAGTSEVKYVIEEGEFMESEGRVWFFVRVQLFKVPSYMILCLRSFLVCASTGELHRQEPPRRILPHPNHHTYLPLEGSRRQTSIYGDQ
jgi:hypothetical protein